MPQEVSFDQQNRIVTVRISGESTKEDHLNARDEALKICQKTGCSKILVDLRGLEMMDVTVFGCFKFGESVSMNSPHVRIAHVMPEDAGIRENIRFTSTVEKNRGKGTGEFETLEEARQWLLGAE